LEAFNRQVTNKAKTAITPETTQVRGIDESKIQKYTIFDGLPGRFD